MATAWIIAFAPGQLPAWLENHQHGAALEAETRRLMALKARRRSPAA